MKLRTKQKLIATVAERWKEQYYEQRKGWKTTNFDPEKVYNHLVELSASATEEDVAKIIGNNSWTKNKCNECEKDVSMVVMLGEEPDYESYTAFVCPDCLKKAIELIKQ